MHASGGWSITAVALTIIGVTTGCASANRATAASAPRPASSPAVLAMTAAPSQSSSTLPPEFVHACGHPGAEVTVDALPVRISHRDCDLTGVVIHRGMASLTVPSSGGGAAAAAGAGGASPGGAPTGSEIEVDVDPTTGDVTMTTSGQPATPAGSAAAQDVVRAYVKALNARDVTTAKHYLTTAHATQIDGEYHGWFTDLISATGLSVHPASARGPYGGPAAGYAQIVQVYVDFTLTWAHPETIPNGKDLWSYILVRNSDSDPWLIADEGLG
jgi:hypothetical protein